MEEQALAGVGIWHTPERLDKTWPVGQEHRLPTRICPPVQIGVVVGVLQIPLTFVCPTGHMQKLPTAIWPPVQLGGVTVQEEQAHEGLTEPSAQRILPLEAQELPTPPCEEQQPWHEAWAEPANNKNAANATREVRNKATVYETSIYIE